MIKKIFALLFVAASISFAQNPDGKNVSLHLTPVWNWGNAKYNSTSYIFYPEQYQFPAQTLSANNRGTVEYPIAFGIHALVKMPTFSFLTVSVSYTYNQKFEQNNKFSTLNFFRISIL
ncbi:MAG: hypothetical protein FD122_3854 [Stygiobacter sp.]|nr:MAG: hypothetical protein FD122_3854 [Stygiobacter sp.]